jgi:hypothetical protein
MKKQGRAAFFCLCFFCAATAGATGGHGAHGNGKAHFALAPAASAPSGNTARAAGTVHNSLHRDPRSAPPLVPARKVLEQDCSRPVDLTQGNLKCK